MKYLDSNVFILPVLYKGKKAKKAKKILTEMVEGKKDYATSSLTFDEIVWAIMKIKDRDKAILVGKDFICLPNLKILDVKERHLLNSLELLEKYPNLKPRDAIHISVSISSGIFTIISGDKDFENISEINREKLD